MIWVVLVGSAVVLVSVVCAMLSCMRVAGYQRRLQMAESALALQEPALIGVCRELHLQEERLGVLEGRLLALEPKPEVRINESLLLERQEK